MGKIVDTLFGGTDKSALKSQKAANDQLQRLIAKEAAGARQDLLGMYPSTEGARAAGVQGALDVYGQTIPQQLGTFQQGNMGAQAALLGGLPQFSNAILGLPVDMSAFQPQAIGYDPSFVQQQLPVMPEMTGFMPDAPLAGVMPGGTGSAVGAPGRQPGGGQSYLHAAQLLGGVR